MLFRGQFATDLSGSVNGLVAARNRGGPYFRSRVSPVDPATARQLNCRTAMSEAYTDWAGSTDEYRQAWQSWADSIRRTNRIGDERHHSGWNEYCRWAVLRKQVGSQLGTYLGTGGATPKLPEAGVNFPLVASLESGNTVFRLSYDPSDWWTHDQDNALVLFLCSTRSSPGVRAIGPIRSTINFFRGPYEMAAAAPGDPDAPLSGHLDYPISVDVIAGQRFFWRARLTTDDHGMSTPYSGVVVAV